MPFPFLSGASLVHACRRLCLACMPVIGCCFREVGDCVQETRGFRPPRRAWEDKVSDCHRLGPDGTTLLIAKRALKTSHSCQMEIWPPCMAPTRRFPFSLVTTPPSTIRPEVLDRQASCITLVTLTTGNKCAAAVATSPTPSCSKDLDSAERLPTLRR